GAFTEQIDEAMLQMEEASAEMDEEVSGFMSSIFESSVTMLQETLANFWTIQLVTLLSIILSLLGAFLMFRMKKIGFHVYVISKIVGLSVMLFYTYSWMIGATYGIFGVLTLAFIIMYAVNLKHFK